MKWARLYNPMMRWLLRSPLHGIVSRNLLLITFAGRKSGKIYTVPVEYIHQDETLYVLSWPERVWWRNLRGGVAVTVQLRGEALPAIAHASLGDVEQFTHVMTVYLSRHPDRAEMMGVGRTSDGSLNADDLTRRADKIVVITLQLG